MVKFDPRALDGKTNEEAASLVNKIFERHPPREANEWVSEFTRHMKKLCLSGDIPPQSLLIAFVVSLEANEVLLAEMAAMTS